MSFVLSSEEDDESLTKMEFEKDIGITTVIAQAEGMVRKMGVAIGVWALKYQVWLWMLKQWGKKYGVVQL